MKALTNKVSTLAEQLVGRRTGIVRELVEIPHRAGEPAVHVYAGTTCPAVRCDGQAEPFVCSGAGLGRQEAMLACLGEGVERYCCQFVNRQETVTEDFTYLSDSAVPPDAWALFSEEQYALPAFPFHRMRRDSSLHWVPAVRLNDGRTELVPACMVYMPYVPCPPEQPIAPTCSTGLSCGSTVEDAMLSGLYEVIERDALAIAWLKRVPTARVTDIPSDIAIAFNAKEIDYQVFDLTSNVGVPVYLVLSRGDSDHGMVIAAGTAANGSAYRALHKACLESVQGRLAIINRLERGTPGKLRQDFADVQTFQDHGMVLTARPGLLNTLDFLGSLGTKRFDTVQVTGDQNVPEDLHRIVARLDDLGMEVLVKDLTTDDVRSLGLCVVRVLVPGMQPLHGHHLLPFLGGRRLAAAAAVFGVARSAILPPGQFNPIPHPLP